MEIIEISEAEMAFPARVDHILPKWKDIPDEFKNLNNGTKWNKLFSAWFFSGLTKLKLTPKPNVDKDKAMRMISVCMRSFDPKHEHKEAGVAYMLSEFFEDCSYKAKGSS